MEPHLRHGAAGTANLDEKYRLWHVVQGDPDSDLHAESRDAEVMIRYITAHDRDKRPLRRP